MYSLLPSLRGKQLLFMEQRIYFSEIAHPFYNCAACLKARNFFINAKHIESLLLT